MLTAVKVVACAAVLATALSTTACGHDSTNGASPSPSVLGPGDAPAPTASPTVEPPADVPIPPEFQGRDPDMSDQQALSRVQSPATGELWLTRPREAAMPPWAEGDPFWGGSSTTWWELGRRGGATIYGVGDPGPQSFFENHADDTWTWIAFPSPRHEAPLGGEDLLNRDGVSADAVTYYDTLALPDSITLRGGEVLLWGLDTWGIPQLPPDADEAQTTAVQTIGPHRVMRHERPVVWVWDQAYDVDTPELVSFRDVYYTIETAYGMWIPLTYLPFGILEDVDWDIETEFTQNDYLVDINDIRCGPDDTDHNTIVDGMVPSDWRAAGTSQSGETVSIPTSTNPLLDPMFQAYRAASEDNKFGIIRFTNAPALVGYNSREQGAWVVYLNSGLSGRTWC